MRMQEVFWFFFKIKTNGAEILKGGKNKMAGLQLRFELAKNAMKN